MLSSISADARIAELERTIADLDLLVLHQNELIGNLRSRKNGTYNLRHDDMSQIARAIHEICRGEIQIGLRRLEDLMEDVEPNYRELV
jgi:hypothetical protein